MVYLRVERHVPRILYVRELCARRSLVPRTLQFERAIGWVRGLGRLESRQHQASEDRFVFFVDQGVISSLLAPDVDTSVCGYGKDCASALRWFWFSRVHCQVHHHLLVPNAFLSAVSQPDG